MEKYHSSTQPSYKENLQILQSLEKIIFNLNETNINESAESSFSYFFKDFSYSFNFIVCSIAYSFFLVKGLDKVCFEYLKILETVENERIKDNNNKIFTIFAKFLLSINTQESNYLLEKIDNELLYENIEVSQMNEELSKNDWEFHKHLIKEGYNPNEISRIIRNDEIEKLQEISSQNNFDFNQRIEKSIYERCSFLAKENVTLIEYASFFGSIKCFKFLLINGAKLYNSGKFAVASGNLEIIHLCKQNHSKFSDTYVAAIKFHRNDIFHYLYENKFAKISNLENLGIECILSNNYEILSFLQEKRMKISENIINESIKSGNLFLVQYYLEKFPKKSIKFKATSFCGNKELFNYLVNNQFIDTNIKFIY